MAFNALKRIIKPVYRVVLDMEHGGAIFIQRKNLWGRWVYVQDAHGDIEFEFIQHAFLFVDTMHMRRKYEISMLIRFEGE